MIRRSSLLLLFFAIGCGGGEPPHPTTGENPKTEPTAGKMSEEDAKLCITEYFAKLGLSNLELVAMSHPVEAPADMGVCFAYSITLKCDNMYGDKMTHNHWVVIVGEENGKPKVKTHFDTMAKVMESSLSKEWFAKAGFSEPVGVSGTQGTHVPAELPFLPIAIPEVSSPIVPTGFPLPDLPPPPSLPGFQVPK